MLITLCTHQGVGNGGEDVEGVNAVGAVLPLAVHDHARLLLHPRQVVVLVTVVDGVGSRGRGGLRQGVHIQLVAIVP